jgi:hypothetical protein
MKASELRIGNLVEIIQRRKGIYTTIEASCLDINRIDLVYKPIPITKDLVLRLGFIKEYNTDEGENRYCFYLNNSDDSFYINYDISYNGWYLGASTYGFLKSIEHLHQLQNLYFALTGEELTLKP